MSNEHFGLAWPGSSPLSHVTAAFFRQRTCRVAETSLLLSTLSTSSCLVVKRFVCYMIHPFGLDKF